MARNRQRPFHIGDINAVLEVGQLDATADGRLVAMVVPEVSSDGSRMIPRIRVLDSDAPDGTRTITAKDKSASMPQFSRDGRHLAYLAEQDKEKVQLAVLTAPFSEPRVVTAFEEGVRAFQWLDARRLLVLASPDSPRRRKKAIDAKDDAYEVDADEPVARMWIVPLDGGKPRPVGPKRGHVAVAAASPDGHSVAYVTCEHSTMEAIWRGSELHLLGVRSGRSRLLRRMSAPVSAMWTPQFSPDGTRIAVIDGLRKGMIYPHRTFVLTLDGRRAVMIDRQPDRTHASPKWLDDETVGYVQQSGVRRVLRAAPASGRVGRDLVDLPGSVGDFAASPAAGRVFFVYTTSDAASEVHAVDLTGGGPRCLTALNRRLRVVKASRAEIVRWKSREGWTVEGLFYPPTRNVRTPYATVVVPHGGPHGAVSTAFDARVQLDAARGYAVFLPNFRGSTGYGTKFLLSIKRDWGGGPADDIVRGIRHLARRGLIDMNRLIVHGGSYGGYMTAWLIGHYGFFRAAVASAPVVNNISMWGTTDIPSFKEWSYGGSPLTHPRLYWEQSPVSSLTRCKTPTLVVVGDKDLRVPPNQAQELYRTVKAAGAPAKLVRYPREPHGIGEPRHKLDLTRRVLAWFKEHLGKDSPDR